MNSEEAKSILQAYRPGGADAGDPEFAKALALVERDAKLRAWLQEQRTFDARLAGALQELTVPQDLKASILSERKIVRVPAWRDWRVQAAVAAIIVILLTLAGASQLGASAPFAEFREKLIVQAWNGDRHVDFESSEWNDVGRWLAAQNVAADFSLPTPLAELRLHGASVVELDGHRIPYVCLADGPKHLHLFVVSGAEFPDRPRDGAPDFEKCGGWKTASWEQGDRIFVLTGMKNQAFVSKFRKAGRWTISG